VYTSGQSVLLKCELPAGAYRLLVIHLLASILNRKIAIAPLEDDFVYSVVPRYLPLLLYVSSDTEQYGISRVVNKGFESWDNP
jgi:hypothetical protein